MALSTLIRIMTRICVESTAFVVPTNQRALHTYPCHDPDKCRKCHTYPEAEVFIFGVLANIETVESCHIAPSHLQPKSLEDFVGYATRGEEAADKGKTTQKQ